MTQTLIPRPVTNAPGPNPTNDTVMPTLATVFRAATRSEWTKLRTVRSTRFALTLTIIISVGLGALFTALAVSRWNHRTAIEVIRFDPLMWSFGGLNLAQLSIGVLGVLVMTSEYATGGIKLTLGATPQRRLLLGAKVATFSAVTAAVSLISCLLAFLVGQAILGPTHGGVSLSDPGVLRAVAGGAMRLVFIGALAVGVGAALRRTAGAVAVLFAVLLVLPGLVQLLPSPWNDNVTKYLPSTAGTSMSVLVRLPDLLSPAVGFLVSCGYTAAMLVIAAVLLERRDA